MTTTLKPTALPGSEYGSFEGKPYGRPSSHQTSLTPMGLPGSGYGSFAGRVAFTRSIRTNILLALVARLATIPGWVAMLRKHENVADAAVLAVVFMLAEDKRIETQDQYQATMTVGVWIKARTEDADSVLDEGNPYLYLDRLVVLAEKKIHDPDEWGLHPAFTDVTVNGHDVQDPDEEQAVEALLRLTFTYRHDYQDPEA